MERGKHSNFIIGGPDATEKQIQLSHYYIKNVCRLFYQHVMCSQTPGLTSAVAVGGKGRHSLKAIFREENWRPLFLVSEAWENGAAT